MSSQSEQTELRLALVQARLDNRLSQLQAAEAAGISQISLSRYERGLRMPPLAVLSRLANVYHISLDDFVIALDFDMAVTTDETRPASSRQRQILHSTLAIPIRGYVSAGVPREAWEVDLGTVPVPEFILRAHPNSFALMISGDSLEGDSISDGDIVVVDPDASYQVDKIYIVLLDDGEVTAKHLTIEDGGQITLRASNDDYQELTVTGRVQGRVVWHMRRM